ncbi:MAG: hypothetical protein V4550_04130 [Gemmatimonadota bacterium]
MFTICIHCCQKLGTNELIEHFPVGEKLAFDSDRGRLWVICPHCARWNLTPLEERWEAVEECERQFRAQRLRAQTTNIGYANTRAGLGLVRIGAPLRPEFAAWRYGREFSRRRARAIAIVGGGALLGAGLIVGTAAFGAALFLPHLAFGVANRIRESVGGGLNLRIPRGGSREWNVSKERTMILADGNGGWMLHVRHEFGTEEYRGAEALRFLSMLLARVNGAGARDNMIRRAVVEVEQSPLLGMLEQIAVASTEFWTLDRERQALFDGRRFKMHERHRPPNRAGIGRIDPVKRLAIEMALHESAEQKAIDGDLAELEASWRAAEEIAGIADDLLLPPSVTEFISKNKR